MHGESFFRRAEYHHERQNREGMRCNGEQMGIGLRQYPGQPMAGERTRDAQCDDGHGDWRWNETGGDTPSPPFA